MSEEPEYEEPEYEKMLTPLAIFNSPTFEHEYSEEHLLFCKEYARKIKEMEDQEKIKFAIEVLEEIAQELTLWTFLKKLNELKSQVK